MDLVKTHPATVRTVVFHTRRMLKKELEQVRERIAGALNYLKHR